MECGPLSVDVVSSISNTEMEAMRYASWFCCRLCLKTYYPYYEYTPCRWSQVMADEATQRTEPRANEYSQFHVAFVAAQNEDLRIDLLGDTAHHAECSIRVARQES